MKKIIIIWIGLILMGFSVMAQENTENTESQTKPKKERKERALLPEQGNWAIGVDVLPLLRSLVPIFGDDDYPAGFQGTPYFQGFPYPNVSIMAKYMTSNRCAFRANIGMRIISNTEGYNVRDDAAYFLNPLTEATVTDYRQTNYYGISVALGSEYRCGKKRVIGIFGGDLLFGFQRGSYKYTYGNIMNEFNQIPSTHFGSYYPTFPYSRTLLQKNTGAVSVGAQVTTGVEVYIAPKIALGGQVNLSYIFTYNPQVYKESEFFNELSGKVERRTDIQSPASWSHRFTTNNIGGSLYMIFYF